MSAIAAASLQQGSGIGQVNEAVAQMDKVTQQNAALVEEIAASAEALEERANGLVELVSVFTLTHDRSLPIARPVARPRAVVAAPPVARSVPAARKVAKPSASTAVVSRPTAALATDNDGDWNSF
jgi:methyl-accepting chemotaxis protein